MLNKTDNSEKHNLLLTTNWQKNQILFFKKITFVYFDPGKK